VANKRLSPALGALRDHLTRRRRYFLSVTSRTLSEDEFQVLYVGRRITLLQVTDLGDGTVGLSVSAVIKRPRLRRLELADPDLFGQLEDYLEKPFDHA
jgi:hypothetical protein